jgi:hypothetical protein
MRFLPGLILQSNRELTFRVNHNSALCTEIPNGPPSWVEWAAAGIVITLDTEPINHHPAVNTGRR